MAYATIEDVQARMPQFQLTAISKPTIESSQVFLDDTHAQFNSVMSSLSYVIPITGPMSLAQSREIVCQGTICKILYARAAAVGTDVAVASAERACKQYQAALEALADPDNPLTLGDAPTTGLDFGGAKSSSPDGLLYDECTGQRIEPRVRMSTVW